MKDSSIDVVESLIDRIEKDGVAVSSVEDGHIFGFTLAMLERLVEDARKSGKVIVFVKRAELGKAAA